MPHQINDKSPSASALMFRSAQAPIRSTIRCCATTSTNWGCKRWRFSPPAYKLNDCHSFAVGFIAQHTTAELRQYANFGPAVAGSLRNTVAKSLPPTQVASGIQQVQSGIAATRQSDTTALQVRRTALQTQQVGTYCTASRRIGQCHRQQPRW